MTRMILTFAVAALVAAGCSSDSPLGSGTTAKLADRPGSAKLTVGTQRAGGARNPARSGPRSMGAPTRLETLRFGTTVDSYGLELTLLEVQDSRCPAGAVCIWEGEVKVLLGLKESVGADLGTVWLARRGDQDERATARLGNRVVQLMTVDPYPELDVQTPKDQYTVAVAVSLELYGRPADTDATMSDGTAGGGQTVKPDPTEDDGTGDGKTDYAQLAAALEKNRRNWDDHGINFYQFRFQRSCRCVPEFRREALVRVRDGAIQHAEYTDNGEVVGPADFERFLTLDDLFSLIAEALDGQAARIEVSYDPTYGYPTRLFIDRDLMMADEEVEYQAVDLLPLR